jgi:CheY-like chemotaxis protein
VFRFVLPCIAPRATEVVVPLAGVEPSLPKETHLLIEIVTQDRGLNLQLHDLLIPEGMEMVHAAQADSAIRLVRRYKPDCILVDVDGDSRRDSTEDGQTMLDQLLAEPAVTALPIIILTNDDDLYEHYRMRVAARVKYGFRKSSLLSGIHYALSQSVPVAEHVGEKILCVDDDPEVVTFVTRCLAAEGYEVDSCGSGQEALERVATHEYGLVLLDIAMPGLDGWDVCRRIKSSIPLTGIQVHFVTAKPLDGSTIRMQDAGADGYLLKPFRSEDLTELVHGIIPSPRLHSYGF